MGGEFATMIWLRRRWEKREQPESSRNDELSSPSKHDCAPSDQGVEVALNPVAEMKFRQSPDADEPCPSDPVAPIIHVPQSPRPLGDAMRVGGTRGGERKFRTKDSLKNSRIATATRQLTGERMLLSASRTREQHVQIV